MTFKPTPEQIKVIETDDSVLIVAGPGTGKTRTAIEKARYKIPKISDESLQQVLFLSFSNAAIHRLTSAASIHFLKQEKKKIRLMTYHSFASEILRFYGRFVGLPATIKVMDTLEEKLITLENSWSFSSEEYKKQLFVTAKDRGLLAFDTLIPLVVKLKSSSKCLKKIIGRRYPLVIVDEFQDTSEDQWQLLQLLGEDSQVVAFADPNQIIYSSIHSATVERLDKFKNWKGIKETEFSAHNFRCDSGDILDFAHDLLTGKIYKKKDGDVQFFKLQYREQLRSILALIWKEIHDQMGSKQTVGFLTPTNDIAEKVAVSLRNPPPGAKVAFPVYARIARDEAAHDAVLLALAALRDYAVAENKTTLDKSAIAISAMDVAWSRKSLSLSRLKKLGRILEETRRNNKSKLSQLMSKLAEVSDIGQFMYDFVDALSDIEDLRSSCKRVIAHGCRCNDKSLGCGHQLLLFDTLRENRHPKGLDGYDAGEGKTHVLNYHKAKGREFDFVVMVVDPRGESNKTLLDEQRRLYYVCATRAKEWLGVIYYSNDLGRVLGPVISHM